MKKILLFIKDIFTKRIIAKITCIIIATIIWLYISDKYIDEYNNVEFPLKFETSPGIVVLTHQKTIKANLRGPIGELKTIVSQRNPIVYRIDIPYDSFEGRKKLSIKLLPSDFHFSRNVEISNISPSEIQVTLTKQTYRYIKVKPKFINTKNTIYEYEVEPNEVKVYGPWKVLRKLKYVYTEEIDLSGKTSDFSRVVKISKYVGNKEISSEEKVKVRVHIKYKLYEKKFTHIPVNILLSNDFLFEINLSPKTIDLTVKGSQKKIEQLLPIELIPYVDIRNLKIPGKYKVPIKFILPPEISAVPSSQIIIVEIKKKNLMSKNNQ